MCKLLALLYAGLWIITNIGVILNKVWDESCNRLFTYLLMMSLVSLAGVVLYLYLGIVKYGSDTQWLLLTAVGAVVAVCLAIFLAWGIVGIVKNSGLLGVYQCFECTYPNGTAVDGTCPSDSLCQSDSWKLIYSESDCTNATSIGITCEVSELCVNSANHTFWYALVSTGLYALVLMVNAGTIFTRLIPSLILQSTRRSRLI